MAKVGREGRVGTYESAECFVVRRWFFCGIGNDILKMYIR